jgi:formylglycine-generating enzyme required for sulfatase activity
VCVDLYEESVWSIPPESGFLISRVRSGRAGLAELVTGGASQVGAIPPDGCTYTEYPDTFPPTGNWTTPLYAVSVPGVFPSTCITWFQAEQACRLSGKRLITNEEWQAAAAGTPDAGELDDQTTTCATNSPFATLTGTRPLCVSVWGVHEMAGNVWEYVAGWVNAASTCTNWDALHGDDLACMGTSNPQPPPPGELVSREVVSFNPSMPGAVIRGGNYSSGSRNGIFAIHGGIMPNNQSRSTGFRCAR